MKIVIPKSIYAGIAIFDFPEKILGNVEVKASSLISKSIENGEYDIGLIPSLDLINHPDLFVSRKTAISFDGDLGNSFLYFNPSDSVFENLHLYGDVSSNELILSKLILEELYSTKISLNLETRKPKLHSKNLLIVGDENLEDEFFNKGISFANQVAEFLDAPYVNFVFASKSEQKIIEFNNHVESLDSRVENNINKILEKLNFSDDIKNSLKSNYNSIYFDLTENEINGFYELIKIPYYRGIVDEMIEVNFV